MRIAVVGGGIGGLASALALTQAGFSVDVYERSPQLIDQGAGVTLAPNATRVLYHLGLGDALEATAVTQPVSDYRHYRTGKTLRRVVRADDRTLFGAPHLRMHRWDLQTAMVDRLADVAPGALHLGRRVTSLSRLPAGDTELTFQDGGTTTAEIVVAADGIRSETRESLFHPAPPTFSGFIAWRGLVSTQGLPPPLLESVVSFGQGRHLNRYLVRRGDLVNFVAIARRDKWEAEGWTIPADLEELLTEFSTFDSDSLAILSRPLRGQLFKWGLFGRVPLDTWHKDGVVLLGDAAHPMLPFQGQGAAMAIEDAIILARALRTAAAAQQGFALYQQTRQARTRHATERAAAQGRLYEGEPDETTLRGDDRSGLFAYDAIATPLGDVSG
ncbi:MAG TPA: FAD-dependent monooxygenase [Rhodopila sp.]|nr:FAD-dependent monooxygenase [Rhodopila sp.]